MCRRFTEPRREDFDTEEEYLEELNYYDQAMELLECYWKEEYFERKYATANL